MKDPDIPGSHSPQIASDPAAKKNNIPSGNCIGDMNVKEYVMPAPIKNVTMSPGLHFLISRKTRGAEIRINPKKNDQIRMA